MEIEAILDKTEQITRLNLPQSSTLAVGRWPTASEN
jgi:hypothetical protein